MHLYILCAGRDALSFSIKLAYPSTLLGTVKNDRNKVCILFWLLYACLSLSAGYSTRRVFTCSVFGRKTKSSANQQTSSAPEGLTGNWEGLAPLHCGCSGSKHKCYRTPLLSLHPSLSLSVALSYSRQAAFSSAYVSAILRGLKMICWSLCEHSINSWFLRAQCRPLLHSLPLSLCLSVSLSLSHWRHLSACATKASFNAHLLKVQERRGWGNGLLLVLGARVTGEVIARAVRLLFLACSQT